MIPSIFREAVAYPMYGGEFDLSRPFIHDGYLMATDRRVMVRAPIGAFSPAELEPFSAEGRTLPSDSITRIWAEWMAEDRAAYIDLPETIEDRICCAACHGLNAPWTWPLIPRGDIWCDDCEGDGWICGPGVNLGAVALGADYLGILLRAGVRRVYPGSDSGRPVYFRGDGFEGLLQPLDYDKFMATRAA